MARFTTLRWNRLAAGAIATVLVLSGCSVGSEDTAIRVPPDEIPFQLNSETTTTVRPTETTTVVRDEVELYLVQNDRLAVVVRDAVASDPQGVLSLLAAGPNDVETQRGLRTALIPELAVVTGVVEELVTIDLAAGFIELAPLEQRLALAQITYSVTQLSPIDDVRFLVAGQEASVPRGDGSSTDQPVTPADYAVFAPA
ncbi:MAG: GerMN domain-containing protein [Ilumatobacteraceae bacterium]